MRRINWHTIRLILIIATMIFLYSFSLKRNSCRKINKIQVNFEGQENMFVTHQMVNNLLIQNFGDAKRIQKDKVDLNTLETILNEHEMIEKAQVFSSIDGVLNAQITQKIPIVRVIANNESYYLDSKGNRMSLSENFMQSIDLQNGVFEEEGLKMLEKWEKEGISLLLGDSKSEIIKDANDENNILELEHPVAEPVKVERRNQYDSLFE